MSVDYYNCAKCGQIFPDCDTFEYCEHCGNLFCSEECADLNEAPDAEEDETHPQCCICRCTFDDLSNDLAMPLLLEVYGMSRETAMKLIKGHLLNKK